MNRQDAFLASSQLLPDLSESAQRMAQALSSESVRAIVMCMCVVCSIEERLALPAAIAACRWVDVTEAEASGGVAEQDEDKAIRLKRFAAQSLYVVTSAPGLLDALRLLLGLMSSLLGDAAGAGRAEDAGQVAVLLHLCLATVRLFLKWLDLHPHLHVIAVVDRSSWQQFEGKLDAFLMAAHGALRGSVKAEGNAVFSGVLPEDEELAGFLPLETIDEDDEDGPDKSER